MRDIKFIITKDHKHFKSESQDHYIIAKHNGYEPSDIIEAGLVIDNKFYILECYEPSHKAKIEHFNSNLKAGIWQDVNKYSNELTAYRVLKARECENNIKYAFAGLKQGD